MTNRKILLTVAIAAVVGSVQAADLKTDADKVGYALGVDMGSTVKEIGVDKINIEAVVSGLKDAAEGKELAMKRRRNGSNHEILRRSAHERNAGAI